MSSSGHHSNDRKWSEKQESIIICNYKLCFRKEHLIKSAHKTPIQTLRPAGNPNEMQLEEKGKYLSKIVSKGSHVIRETRDWKENPEKW